MMQRLLQVSIIMGLQSVIHLILLLRYILLYYIFYKVYTTDYISYNYLEFRFHKNLPL